MFTLSIDDRLRIRGSGFSNEDNGTFTIRGTANPNRDLQIVAGSTSTGATFTGTALQNGTGLGTWVNNFFGQSGTWMMTKR